MGRHRLEVENDLFTSDLVGSYRLDEHIEVYTGVRKAGNKFRDEGSRVETEFIQSGPTLGWAWNF